MTSRSSRGYILLEAIIGGAVASVGLAAALITFSDAHTVDARNLRKAAAARILGASVDAVRAAGFDGATPGDTTDVVVVNRAQFTVFRSTGAVAAETVAATALPFKDVSISVTSMGVQTSSTVRLYR